MGVVWRTMAVTMALSLGLAGQAQAKWLRADTQRFTIYSDGGEFSLRNYASMLEDFDIVLRHYHNVDQRIAPPRKLVIYLVQDKEALDRAASGLGDSTAGFYKAGLDDIFAVAIVSRRAGGSGAKTGSRIDKTRTERNDILFHEYTHHFVAQYAAFPYPAWMVEGLAEYFAPTEIRSGKVTVGGFDEGRAWTISEKWMPLDELLSVRGVPDRWAEFYAQSWLLTHYMLMDPQRREQLERYKEAIARGEGSNEAMQAATGMDIDALTTAVRAYSRGSVPILVHERQKLADLPIAISELPPSADDLLLENQKLMNGLREEERKPLLDLIRQRAAKYPGDRLAQITLARAEVFYGDRAAREAILKAYLAGHSDDAEALRLMARSRILTAQDADDADEAAKVMASARPYLVKANEIEIDNYQTYYYFAQSGMYDPGYPSDNTMELLSLAHQIAPQVDEITFQAAQSLVIRKRFDEARPMLLSLANDPHGGGLAEAAKSMLRQIDPPRPN